MVEYIHDLIDHNMTHSMFLLEGFLQLIDVGSHLVLAVLAPNHPNLHISIIQLKFCKEYRKVI